MYEQDCCFDELEPSCWACGVWYSDKYDLNDVNVTDKEIKRMLDKTPFQRCHIIPKSLGGSDDPSNLFLMCKECHDLAPDSISKELFLTWAKNQNYYTRKSAEIKKCLEDFGLSVEDLDELCGDLSLKDMYEMMNTEQFKKMIGIHGSQRFGGIRLKSSSVLAAQIEFLRNRKNINIKPPT